ncbi:MAG TPA: ABC transporter substrate-binding protein [Stellaceae bacterium]|nr:ABC transporter substrate-binding protein [Stellaceae bacterium]
MRALFVAILLFLTVPARAADTVETGAIGSPSGSLWPIYIGESKGFFARAGVDIDLIFVPSTSGVIQQLTAGSLDAVASTGLPEPISAIDKGAAIAIVRIVSQANPYALVARPGISSIRDLKGKTISLGGTTDITAIYFAQMAKAENLAKSDYDVVVVGATAGRLAGLRSGAVAATLLLPPILFEAEDSGFVNLGLVYPYTKDLPFAGFEVNRAWASAHLELAKRMLAAFDESVAWFYDDKNRDEAISILASAAKMKRDDVAKTYDLFRKITFFAPFPTISRALLDNLMKAEMAIGDRDHIVPADRLIMPELAKLGD